MLDRRRQHTALGGVAKAALTLPMKGLLRASGLTGIPAVAAGRTAVWYDPSDLSTMWQEDTKVTPAAVDSPVGYIEDKLGSGVDAYQVTASKRPILRQRVGGRLYLEFDGVDDELQTAAAPFGELSDAVVTASYRERVRQNSGLFILSSGQYWYAYAPWGDGNVHFDVGGAGAGTRVSSAIGVAAGNDLIATFAASVNSSEQYFRIDGVEKARDASGATVSGTGSFRFGSRGGINFMAVDIYELVAVIDTLPLADIETLEQEVAE